MKKIILLISCLFTVNVYAIDCELKIINNLLDKDIFLEFKNNTINNIKKTTQQFCDYL